MSDEIPSTPPSSSQRQSSATGDADVAASAAAAASNVQFPYRLHELLDEVDPSIITWLPDTQAFKVLDKQTFTEKTLPHYFNATKYKSFQRNLNLWGFQTIQEGPNKGGCFHPLFARGSREKVHYMTRQKVKGINGNGSSNGKPPVNRSSLPSHKMSLAPGVAGGGSMVVGQQQQLQQHPAMLPSLAEIAVATNPGLMMALREARTSNFTDDELKALPFMKKLHHILAQPELGDCISWTPDGRCIRVIDPFKFLEKAQAKYFDHSDITSFSSFLLELESYGFRKVTHLGISECYYHDLMIRGCHHLCKYMQDAKSAKNFVTKDPWKDLEIDQAFGIASFLPQAPVASLVNNSETAMMLELQRQQHMAAFQAMGTMVANPAMAGMGGLNPGLLQHASPGASSTTPISNYLAANSSTTTNNSRDGGGSSSGKDHLSSKTYNSKKGIAAVATTLMEI